MGNGVLTGSWVDALTGALGVVTSGTGVEVLTGVLGVVNSGN